MIQIKHSANRESLNVKRGIELIRRLTIGYIATLSACTHRADVRFHVGTLCHRRPNVGPTSGQLCLGHWHLPSIGPMLGQCAGPAFAPRRADVGPLSGRCRANVGPILGQCRTDANACPTIIADSMLVYIGPTSDRHWPDIGPTSAQHWFDIGPTSA